MPRPRRARTRPPEVELQEVDSFLEEIASLAQVEATTDVPAADGAAYRPDADPAARALAEAMHRAPGELAHVCPAGEAGEDAGCHFYTVEVAGFRCALRRDGLRAFLAGWPSVLPEDHEIVQQLQGLGLCGVRLPQEGLRQVVDRGRHWVLVAEGSAAVPGRGGSLQLFDPGHDGRTVAPDALSLSSLELEAVLRGETLDPRRLAGIQAIAAGPGERIGRVATTAPGTPGRDVFGRSLPAPVDAGGGLCLRPGRYVDQSADGELRAQRFGYVALLEGALSIAPPVWVDPKGMEAHWLVAGQGPQPCTPQIVEQCLRDLGVVHGLDGPGIEALAGRMRTGQCPPGAYLVARGTSARHGDDAVVEILVDMERKAGQVRPDGSVDFREVNYAPNVARGQVIGRRKPPTAGLPGGDVRGQVLVPRDGKDRPLEPGDNVTVEIEDGVHLLTAAVDGIAELRQNELSVRELLTIKGDVSFSTGNLEFRGEVYVDGSVVQGFRVRSGASVTITGTVEAGATVVAEGDISVGKGIVGRRTRVTARGSMRAQFVQEARVLAGGDIELGNYAMYAYLRAGGDIRVAKGEGTRGGSIIGGETWVRQVLEVHFAGAPTGVQTRLTAAIGPEDAEQLDKLRSGISASCEHILRILKKFGLSRIDVSQIRNMISAAVGPRRRILAHQAQQLGQLAQVRQKLLADTQVIQEKVRRDMSGAEIRVQQRAFGGVEVRVGDLRRKLSQDLMPARFHVHDGELKHI